MDQPVQDGVRRGGVWNEGVPLGHRDLAGDNRGPAAVLGVQDLPEIAGLLRGQRLAPVLQNYHVRLRPRPEHVGIGVVEAGHHEFPEQPTDPDVPDPIVVRTGRMPEGAGPEGLAHAGGARDEHHLVAGHPARGEPLLELAADGVVIDVRWGGGEAPRRLPPPPGEPVILPTQPFRFDEEPQPVVEREIRPRGILLLLLPGLRPGGESELPEPVEGGMGQHRRDGLS